MPLSPRSELIGGFIRVGLAVATALNSAALLVLISQQDDYGSIPDLVKGLAIWLWSAGVLAAVLGWLGAFLSARSFSDGSHAAGEMWALSAAIATAVAMGCFVWGCWIIGYALTLSPD